MRLVGRKWRLSLRHGDLGVKKTERNGGRASVATCPILTPPRRSGRMPAGLLQKRTDAACFARKTPFSFHGSARPAARATFALPTSLLAFDTSTQTRENEAWPRSVATRKRKPRSLIVACSSHAETTVARKRHNQKKARQRANQRACKFLGGR